MDTVVSALRHAPALTAALIERFRALHDPKARDAKRAGALEADIMAGFADIKSIDDDRILRLFHAVIGATLRSEEHTSELQSLMRISYAVFCLKKKTHQHDSIKSKQT